ncbi:MAG: hypothetical protein JXD23_10070 [Spirochaetales bacterium]|nr:hypothetical protein [Spirochaetales bacterium]
MLVDHRLKKDFCGSEAGACPLIMHYLPAAHFLETRALPGGKKELCVTTLDGANLIPIIRYRTGDNVNILSPAALQDILQKHDIHLSSAHLRGLPVGVYLGRAEHIALSSGDRLGANEIKEALFMDDVIAASVTGNFKITRNGRNDNFRILIQLHPGKKASAFLRKRMMINLGGYIKTPIDVSFIGFSEFPYGFAPDYERKNRYL